MNNTTYPTLSLFLLLRFDSYTLPNRSNILPYLLIKSPKPTPPYRTSPKIASVPLTIHTSPIPSTSNPTIAFRIVYIYSSISVPCDPSTAKFASVIRAAGVTVGVGGEDDFALLGFSSAEGTIWWVREGESGVWWGERRRFGVGDCYV